jgi:hypothetical protein
MSEGGSSLEARLSALEDKDAIRELKARYLRACDLKDVEGLRATLLPEAVVAYEGFPPFADRESFVDIFQQMGCQPGIYDIHHATNSVIEFTGADEATGKWSLHFQSIMLAAKSITQMGVEYEDRYVRRDGRWLIAETRTTRPFCLIQSLDGGGRAQYVAIGEPPAVYGEAPA